MRLRISLSLCALLSGVSACATRQSFMPAENVTDITDAGYYAAHYEVPQPGGGVVEIKVWSGGTFTGEADGERAAFAHVGFILQNGSASPVRLDPRSIRLEAAQTADGNIGPLASAEADGNGEVPDGASGELEALFRLPEDVAATELRGFEIAWTLTSGGRRYTQHTPFLRAMHQPLPRYYYYSPFDDPFYYYPGVRGRIYLHDHHPYFPRGGVERRMGVPGRRR